MISLTVTKKPGPAERVSGTDHMQRGWIIRNVAFLLGIMSVVAACAALGVGSGRVVDRSDPRFASCAGDRVPVIAAFPMAAARDYKTHLPKMGRSPELDASVVPAFVVVFEGVWPGAHMVAPPRAGTTLPPRSLEPGSHDVCVWVGDAATGQLNVYEDVDTAGMAP